MHEASIASALVKVCLSALEGRNIARVKKVDVSVGVLAGVVPHALENAFAAMAEGTALEGAVLQQHTECVSIKCADCSAAFSSDKICFECPACGSLRLRMTRGEDVFVLSVEAEEPENEG